MVRNSIYDMLRFQRPTREDFALALVGKGGARPFGTAARGAPASMFRAAQARLDQETPNAHYHDFPQWVLGGGGSGLAGLGTLPEYGDILKAGGSRQFAGGDQPNILGTTPDGRVWGDGINTYIPDFPEQYARAQTISRNIERMFVPSTAPYTKLQELDRRLVQAMKDANEAYFWDKACTWEKDYWHNCRTPAQVDRLKSAYARVRDALREYPALEVEAAGAPREWRLDYNPAVEAAYKAANPNASSLDIQRRFFREQAIAAGGAVEPEADEPEARAQRRGASRSAGGGMPSWALPAAGGVLLLVLVGGLWATSKPKATP